MLTRERGSANWPFIISFVLLLVFGWLWYDQKGEADKFREDAKKSKDQVAEKDKVIGDR